MFCSISSVCGVRWKHEDRALAPADDDLLAWLDLADVEIDRAAGGKRRGVGVHLVDQRHQSGRQAPTAPTVPVAM